ncbi:CRISPR/Cas system-associated exonuclease Cas4 (RecB family) [Methanofollis sp. W23]|nr:CRISPR/Cas system-associated exonuclease Cas4 (RecB family) [Methanofollis sp. W23]
MERGGIYVPHISKAIFLNTIFCQKLGWMQANRTEAEEVSAGDQFRIHQGLEIGEAARKLFPEGIYIEEKNLQAAAQRTQELIRDTHTSVLFEATFLVDGYATKADILQREGDQWKLIEVKSNTNFKEQHMYDMAYTAAVLTLCGLDISTISILLVSKDFRLGMDVSALFIEGECTGAVVPWVGEFREHFPEVKEILQTPRPPSLPLSFKCKKCPMFTECHGKDIENHIFTIPRLSEKKFTALVGKDIVRIEDIPEDFALTKNQRKHVECVQCGEPVIDPGLRSALDEIVWPVHYLDFETTTTAIPLYPNLAPYCHLPIQYSIHTCPECGKIDRHSEYLADPTCDCRRRLAERLIEDLDDEGSILVYTSFERTTIKGLIQEFPDLEGQLQDIITRLVDLEKIVRSVNHPLFKGRTSIKVALPALVPGMSYDGLAIADGETAMATFALMAKGVFDPAETEKKRQELLEYCTQDTLAMVWLHDTLAQL